MKRLLQVVLIPCQTYLIVCILALQAIAGQVWAGEGQVVKGSGQGGSTTLKLDLDSTHVTFESGPSQGRSVSVSNGIARTPEGRWELTQSGNELQVTFYTPDQIVTYSLHHSKD